MLFMSRKISEISLMFIPAVAEARPPISEFSNPIAAVVLIGVILMCLGHWLKGAKENPVGAFRMVLACVAGMFVGFGTPVAMMKLNFDPGAWIIPIWISGWVVAYKVGMLIAGSSDDEKKL